MDAVPGQYVQIIVNDTGSGMTPHVRAHLSSRSSWRPTWARPRCGRATPIPGPIDILVSDVVVPGMGGRRVADELAVRRPRCHVLCMSGYHEEMLADRGSVSPSDGFIQKPFAPVRLVERVREVLDRRL